MSPDASPNVLSQRLRDLEAGGVVRKHSVGAAAYELTDFGHELRPLLLQLGRWGARSTVRATGSLSVSALLSALEATFDADRAEQLEPSLELGIGHERFSADVRAGSLRIVRGAPARSDATVETDGATLRAVVFGDRKLSEAKLEIRGDARTARKFLRCFRRPR